MSREEDVALIPETIYDQSTHITYKKGKFYGKGGFAKCYEIINAQTKQSFAGKVVPKKMLVKENQKEKMTQEIQIHQSLNHKNVVGFYGFFEDRYNIYIVLELCRKRSMMELHKRRKILPEAETRYYMKQILTGVSYLHHKRIIHRDLKLGNLFLNDELHVKIGDFGLAASIEFEGERKETLCGTPNYIAPEILNKKGHSFEVDIWSIGCIMYTLLLGRPPFETTSLKETYSRIKKCDYRINNVISPAAKQMIMSMLRADPKSRPKVNDLLVQEFMTSGYCPASLPLSCLTMAPRFDNLEITARKPLSGLNNVDLLSPAKKGQDSITAFSGVTVKPQAFDATESFKVLKHLLAQVLKVKPQKDYVFLDEMTDPAAQPMIWVSKWVDYSDKYGFGYQLSDECVGVMFNDITKLILLPNGINVHYIDKAGDESYMTVDEFPPQFEKKMKLLSYFSRYMREHLIKTGASVMREVDFMSRTPHLHQWCRSSSGVLMQLNNGTVQINFSDHSKIVMCPLMAAITYIDEEKSFRTFRFSTLANGGCSRVLYDKMRYAYEKIAVLQDTNNHYVAK